MGKNNITKNIFVVVGVSVLTKLLGLIKQIIISNYFGMTGETDAFLLVSGTINDIGTALFSALAIVYLADYIKIKERKIEQLHVFSTNVATVFLIIALIICVVVEVFAIQIVGIIAPGFSKEALLQARDYLRILAPMFVVLCARTIANSILDAEGKFWYGKSLGTIQSLCLIGATILLSKKYGVVTLVYALVITYIIELALGFWTVCRNGYYKISYSGKILTTEVKGMISCMVPLFISNSILDINALVARGASSMLGEGVVSALSYAQTLKQFVNTILITSTLTVLYTNLVKKVTGKDDKINSFVLKSISIYLIILLPICLVTIFCAEDIVCIVYGRGAVTEEAVKITAQALRGYGFGFIPVALNGILLRTYYSFSETRYTMLCSVWSVIVNSVIAIFGAKYVGIIGITLAASISSLCSFVFLALGAKKRVGKINWNSLKVLVIKMLIAACITAIIAYKVNDNVTVLNQWWNVLIQTGIIGGSFYLSLAVMRCKELKYLTSVFKNFLCKG